MDNWIPNIFLCNFHSGLLLPQNIHPLTAILPTPQGGRETHYLVGNNTRCEWVEYKTKCGIPASSIWIA